MVALWDESYFRWYSVYCCFLVISCRVSFSSPSHGIHPPSVSSLVTFRGSRLWSLWCLSLVGCFVSAIRLLYSFRGSLFLSWTFFLCCLWVLRVLSVCDSFRSMVPLATGSPVGTSPFCFLLALLYFPPVVSSGYFVGSSLVFIILSVSGVNTLLSPFRLDSFLSSFSVEGSCSLHLFFIFFSFRLPGLLLLLLLSFAILRCSSVWFLVVFFLCWGFSLQGLSPSPWSSQHLVSSGVILPVFVPTLSFVLFFVSLVHPLHLACFGLEPFLLFFSCLVHLSLSLHWVVLALFFGLSEVSHSVSTSGGALFLSFAGLSCRLYVFLAFTSSLLSRCFRPWLGLIFRCVFLVCLFLLFGFPYHVL